MKMVPPAPAAEGFWTSRRFLLVLAAALIAVFPQVFIGQTTFYFRDAGALGYPVGFFFKQCLLHGHLPLWDAYSHCGVPFLAQMGTWYPVNWLFIFLPAPWSLNLCLLLHLLLGGWGVYALLRQWGVGGFAASFAGLAYVFNGVSFSCFQWGNYIESLGWLPWVVLTVTEAWRQGGRWIVLAAVVSALQVLTATPELTLLGWLFLAALWLGELSLRKVRFWLSSRRTATVILLAAGITMVQMLPFFDLLAHSQRSNNYEQNYWAMPGWGWANFIVPLFHSYLSPQGNWFQHDQDFLMSYYPGLGVLALALVGVWCLRSRASLIIAASVLICWVLALGNTGHLYLWAKKIFPWLGIARFPIKYTILPSFLLPLLAAFAIQQISVCKNSRVRSALIVSGLIFLSLAAILVAFARQNPFPFDATQAMTWNAVTRMGLLFALIATLLLLTKATSRRAKLLIQFLAMGLLLTDLLTHNPGITPSLPSSVMAPGLWQADGRPALALGTGRIMESPEAERKLLFSRVTNPRTDFLGKRLAEWYNLNLFDSLPKVDGAITLRPAHFDLVERRIYYTSGSTYGEGLPDFLSAAWISDPENPVKWIARTNYLPVLTAGQRPEFKSDAQALDAMMDKAFNPREVVFLPTAERKLVTVTNSADCTVAHVHFAQSRVEAEVRTTTPSLVVLSQTFYHLWQARVDGSRVPLLRANVAFQALQIPAGTHRVELVYHDPNLMIGSVLSLVSLLTCFVMWRRQPPLEKLDRHGLNN